MRLRGVRLPGCILGAGLKRGQRGLTGFPTYQYFSGKTIAWGLSWGAIWGDVRLFGSLPGASFIRSFIRFFFHSVLLSFAPSFIHSFARSFVRRRVVGVRNGTSGGGMPVAGGPVRRSGARAPDTTSLASSAGRSRVVVLLDGVRATAPFGIRSFALRRASPARHHPLRTPACRNRGCWGGLGAWASWVGGVAGGRGSDARGPRPPSAAVARLRGCVAGREDAGASGCVVAEGKGLRRTMLVRAGGREGARGARASAFPR